VNADDCRKETENADVYRPEKENADDVGERNDGQTIPFDGGENAFEMERGQNAAKDGNWQQRTRNKQRKDKNDPGDAEAAKIPARNRMEGRRAAQNEKKDRNS
jgi:hypothetical protein